MPYTEVENQPFKLVQLALYEDSKSLSNSVKRFMIIKILTT
jgi:hypothetical protein